MGVGVVAKWGYIRVGVVGLGKGWTMSLSCLTAEWRRGWMTLIERTECRWVLALVSRGMGERTLTLTGWVAST